MTELVLQELLNRPKECLLLEVFAQGLTDGTGAAAGRVLHEDVPGFLLHGIVHGEGKVNAVLFVNRNHLLDCVLPHHAKDGML